MNKNIWDNVRNVSKLSKLENKIFINHGSAKIKLSFSSLYEKNS